MNRNETFINHGKIYVDNFGNSDRTHLIVDCAEQSILEKYDI